MRKKYSVYFGNVGEGFKYYYGETESVDVISANDINAGSTTYYFESENQMISHITQIKKSELIHNEFYAI